MNLDLLAASACSSQADLGQLYELLYSRVYNYIRYRSENQAVTEKLVPLIFERQLAALGSYDAERGPFEAWVFAIAHNRVTSHHRARALLHEAETALLAAQPRLKPQQRGRLYSCTGCLSKPKRA